MRVACALAPHGSWTRPYPRTGEDDPALERPHAISATQEYLPGLLSAIRRQRLRHGRRRGLLLRPVLVSVLHLPRRARRLFWGRAAGRAGRGSALRAGARAGRAGDSSGGESGDGPEPFRLDHRRRIARALL